MLDLATLKFSVDTTELDAGVSKIEKLTTALSDFNKANSASVDISKKASQAADSLAKKQDDLSNATSKTAKATKEVEDSINPLEKLLNKLNNQYGDLVSGFTKGEAAILQQARNLGAAEAQLTPVIEVLTRIKELTKDPFDASIGSIRSVTSEFERLTQRANLVAQGISLTTKQLSEYSRLSAEVKGIVSKLNIDPNSAEGLAEYNRRLAEAQTEYLSLAASVNRLESEEKQRNATLKETERLSASINVNLRKEAWDAYSAGINSTTKEIQELNNYFRQLEENSKRVDKANENAIASAERLSKIASMVRGGMSESEATKRLDLEAAGVESATIERLIAATKELSAAKKSLVPASQSAASGMTESAKAAAFLERELNRAENAVKGFEDNLRTSTSNRMFRFSEQLQKAGLNPEEATALMDRYRTAIVAGQKKMERDMEARLRDLSRAVSVQMGDVAVSLATGMNPFLVMIQQGDQLRGAFQQVDASAEDVKRSMTNAAKMIAASFIDTGKAIGFFFIGTITAAGQQIAGLVTGPISALIGAYRTLDSEGAKAASGLQAIQTILSAFKTSVIAALPTLLFAAVTAAAALATAFVQVSREEDELSKNLLLTGASLGLTKSTALDVARSMESMGVSASKSVEIITALAKQGGFLSSQLMTIIPAAEKMMTVFGMTSEEVAKLFAKIKKDPVEALYDLAESMGTVNIEVIRFVEEQIKMGNSLGATQAAIQEAARVNKEAASAMEQDYSLLGKTIMATSKFFKDFWAGVKGLVYTPNAAEKMQQELSDVSAEIKRVEGNLAILGKLGNNKLLNELKAKAEALRENIALQKKQSDAEVKARELASQQASAIKLLSKAADDAATSEEKYMAKVVKIREAMALVPDDVEAQKDAQKALIKLREDYVKSLEKENKLTKEQREAARERKRLENEAMAAIDKITSLTNKGAQAQQHLSDAQKLALDIFKDPDFKKYPEELRKEIALKLEAAHISEMLGKAETDRLKRMKEMNEVLDKQEAILEKFWDNQVQLTAAGLEEYESLKFRYEILGKTAEQQKLLLAQRKAELAYEKEIRDIRNSKVSDNEKKLAEEQAAQRYEQAMKNANLEIALDFAAKFIEPFENIQKGLADAITTALFEGGNAGRKKLRDIIVAELRKPVTLVVNAVVQATLGNFMSQVGGSILNSVTGSGSVLSQIGSVLGLAGGTSGLGSIFNGAGGPISTLPGPGGISSGTGGLAGSSGMFSSIGSMLSTAGPIFAAAMISNSIGKSLSGGYSIGGIGGTLANTLTLGLGNRAFGRKLTQSGVQGTFGPNGFTGNNYTFEKGGWFRSDKTRTSAMDSTVSQTLNDSFTTMKSSIIEMAKSLNLGTGAVSSFTHSFKLNLKDMSEEDATKAIQAELDKANNGMAQLALGTLLYTRQNETAVETLTRLSTNLAGVNSMFDLLGFKLYETSTFGAASANVFADLLGGLENATKALSDYYANFYSEEERTAKATEILKKKLQELGVAMPVDRLAYRAEIEKAMASGNEKLAAALISLSSAFAEITPVVETVKQEISETMKSLLSDGENLRVEWLRTIGENAEADKLAREIATQGMTSLEKAYWDHNNALKNLIESTKEQQKLEQQRANERYNLETQLLQVQGKTDELRARELAKLDPANRALQEQIWKLQDQQKAQDEATKAAEEAAQAVQKLKDAWTSLTDGIMEEVKRIRGLQIGTSAQNFSAVQAQFEATLAAAKSGDQEAAKALPGLSQSLLELASTQAKTSYELRLIQLQTANSLEQVAIALAGKFGVTSSTVPASNTMNNAVTPDPINYGTEATYGSTTLATSNDIVAALDKLNANIDGLRYEVRADVSHNSKVAKLLDRVIQDGQTVSVTFPSAQPVNVV